MRSLERRNLGAVAAADPRQQLMDIEGPIARRVDVPTIVRCSGPKL